MIQMDTTAKISVVMATYNGEKYLREQLESILEQTYPISEIIIQDDCSTDNTAEILKEYSLENPSIHYEINETNLGFNLNFKKAVFRSKGDFVALSDQDDIWEKDKVAKQMSAITDHAMCYCYHLRGTTLSDSHIVKYKCAPERQLLDPIVGHTMLLRGDFARDPSNWLPMVAYDYSLGINAHLKGGVTLVDEPLVFHRSHPGEVTFNSSPVRYSVLFPYIFGYGKFRSLQKKEPYVQFFSAILNRTENCAVDEELIGKLSSLMLSKGALNYFKLCILCMKNYKTICPSKANVLRGFFYPQIYATYHNWV